MGRNLIGKGGSMRDMRLGGYVFLEISVRQDLMGKQDPFHRLQNVLLKVPDSEK